MMNCGDSQILIDDIIELCAKNGVSHSNMIRAALLILLYDMRAQGEAEHNLIDEDGVILINARLMESTNS